MRLNIHNGITTESPVPGKHYISNETGAHVGIAWRKSTGKWCAVVADRMGRPTKADRSWYGEFPTMRDAAYSLVRYAESGDEKWLTLCERNAE